MVRSFLLICMKILLADRDNTDHPPATEFYDFLQVNTDSSNRSEVVTSENHVINDEEVDQESTDKQHGKEAAAAGGDGGGVPLFIDFLSVGCG
ncbi:hypothetical protein Vadar_000056 [Vaccinium darrowii]|uniref:Uncharacterized protein n=1 Tax=Vaccinium darrowii TaxID=229202 RepID=A0ACB7YBX0_9ERIC|nr:hypothetical protein Vadar_000056 [Vaccinium darrowii]